MLWKDVIVVVRKKFVKKRKKYCKENVVVWKRKCIRCCEENVNCSCCKGKKVCNIVNK
jgi:hypothetical protein